MRIAGLKPACLLLTMLAIAACVGEHSPMTAESVEWGYAGPGAPGNWASLSEDYATCADGLRQSPARCSAFFG